MESTNSSKSKDSVIEKKDTVPHNVSNTYHIKGDLVQGNQTKKLEKIVAPNAMIVTTNQSGRNNTINYNQNEFKPINDDLKEALIQKLQSLLKKYPKPPVAIIQIESNSSQRNKIAQQLESILQQFNLGAYPKGNTFIGRFPDYPISVFINPTNRQYTDALIEALKNYISGEYHIDKNEKVPIDAITFYFNGQPLFDNQGKIKFE